MKAIMPGMSLVKITIRRIDSIMSAPSSGSADTDRFCQGPAGRLFSPP
jgi:hypothetical protein